MRLTTQQVRMLCRIQDGFRMSDALGPESLRAAEELEAMGLATLCPPLGFFRWETTSEGDAEVERICSSPTLCYMLIKDRGIWLWVGSRGTVGSREVFGTPDFEKAIRYMEGDEDLENHQLKLRPAVDAIVVVRPVRL